MFAMNFLADLVVAFVTRYMDWMIEVPYYA